MKKGKIVSLEDRVPKLKEQRRKKANRRLISLLFLFFSLIICVIYFQSSLSHVKKITVEGNDVYTEEELILLSGLTKDTNIWKVNEDKIEAKIKDLQEIKSAKVKTRLPSSVSIQIEEWNRIAYLRKDDRFLPVLENGNILEEELVSIPANAPVMLGFTEGEVTEEMIEGLREIPEEVLNSISEIYYTSKEKDKYHISLYMNDGFEVSASLRSFAEKMVHYPSIASQLDPKIKGVIDIEVGSFFKAYGSEEQKEESENDEEG